MTLQFHCLAHLLTDIKLEDNPGINKASVFFESTFSCPTPWVGTYTPLTTVIGGYKELEIVLDRIFGELHI